jgi:DNA-directed RNA polymerase specialized sigma24 family protein
VSTAYLPHKEQVDLVSKARKGDRNAFGTLYECFVEAVTGHVMGRLSTAADAQDVVSDTFTLALKAVKSGRFDPQYSFYTFLRGIADNEVKRFLKKEYVQVAAGVRDGKRAWAPKLLSLVEDRGVAADRVRMADYELCRLPGADMDTVAAELLKLVLTCPAKPHQSVAFCLVRFLEWRPQEMVRELSHESLFDLTGRVYGGLAALFPLEDAFRSPVRRHCPEFWALLVSTIDQVYVEPEYARLGRKAIRKTGDLSIEEFYGPNPTGSLSDWCDKVRNRARKAASRDMLDGETNDTRHPTRRKQA